MRDGWSSFKVRKGHHELLELFLTGHEPAGPRVGSGGLITNRGSSLVGSDRIGSGRVGSGQRLSVCHGWGWVGSGHFQV